MTSETDAEFLDSMEAWVIGSLVFKKEHRERLFSLARKGAAQNDTVLDLLGQVGQLSDELSLAAARIEALEAALQDIAHWEVDHIGAARELARAALAPPAQQEEDHD